MGWLLQGCDARPRVSGSVWQPKPQAGPRASPEAVSGSVWQGHMKAGGSGKLPFANKLKFQISSKCAILKVPVSRRCGIEMAAAAGQAVGVYV